MAIRQKPLTDKELRVVLDTCVLGEQMEETLAAIKEINRLKKEKDAVILAHYYMSDAIKFGIADYVGDSLDLSKIAKETTASTIVFCGVHFMAETAKILNPSKKVILPNLSAGCSLAESITGEDVLKLREKHPDAAVVTYINTTADVKAASDVCVTSACAKKVIRKLPNKKIMFIPDVFMGKNLAEEMPDKEIIHWDGKCIVHDQFDAVSFEEYKQKIPGLKVLAHYECDPGVIKSADMHGGTSDIRRYIKNTDETAYLLATECGLSSTIKAEFPEKNIIGPCILCPYMRKIGIQNTLQSLQSGQLEITVDEAIRVKALASITKMFELAA